MGKKSKSPLVSVRSLIIITVSVLVGGGAAWLRFQTSPVITEAIIFGCAAGGSTLLLLHTITE